jgi:hypothetical protein
MRRVEALLALALLIVVPGIALYAGWRRGRFAMAFGAVVAAVLGVWGASLLTIATDYRDADGHVDCWPHCTAYQKAIGGVFWYTIPLVTLLALASAGVVLVSRWRRRAARRLG